MGLKTLPHQNEGKIRDNIGVKRSEINFTKNMEMAKQKIKYIENSTGHSWRTEAPIKNMGIIQSVLRKGANDNREEIANIKAKQFHERVMQNYDLNRKNCLEKRTMEISEISDNIHKDKLNPEIIRLETERAKAFDMLSKWVERDISNVPDWMMSNKNFTNELGDCSNIQLYESLLERHGINYVVTVSQTVKILKNENYAKNRIELVANTGKYLNSIQI